MRNSTFLPSCCGSGRAIFYLPAPNRATPRTHTSDTSHTYTGYLAHTSDTPHIYIGYLAHIHRAPRTHASDTALMGRTPRIHGSDTSHTYGASDHSSAVGLPPSCSASGHKLHSTSREWPQDAPPTGARGNSRLSSIKFLLPEMQGNTVASCIT